MSKAPGGPPLEDEDLKLPATGIRADVLQAARQVWPQFRRRAVLLLGSQKRAAKLMEAAALSLSRQLGRQKQKAPLVKKPIAALLKAHLDLALPHSKRSSRKRPVSGTKGGHAGVANATAGDFAAFTEFDDQTSMIVAMRSWGHTWKEIAAMLGITSSNARSAFLRAMQTVHPTRSGRKRRDGKKGTGG